ELGDILRPHLQFEDRVACRLPYVPYYAGAGFCRTPVAAYAATMDSLVTSGATHLLLLEPEMTAMLPQLRPLFDDARFAAAEGRRGPLAEVDARRGRGALLYRFRPPAISAQSTQVAARDATSLAWAESVLVYTTPDGKVISDRSESAGPARAGRSDPLGEVTGARDVH